MMWYTTTKLVIYSYLSSTILSCLIYPCQGMMVCVMVYESAHSCNYLISLRLRFSLYALVEFCNCLISLSSLCYD
jgi:hypothetical protein